MRVVVIIWVLLTAAVLAALLFAPRKPPAPPPSTIRYDSPPVRQDDLPVPPAPKDSPAAPAQQANVHAEEAQGEGVVFGTVTDGETGEPVPGARVVCRAQETEAAQAALQARWEEVVASGDEEAADQVFSRDCMVMLGTCLATVSQTRPARGVLEYRVEGAAGPARGSVAAGDVCVLPLPTGEQARVELRPSRSMDVGAGPAKPVTATVTGGVVGVVIDARGRPFTLPAAEDDRKRTAEQWAAAFDAYPDAAGSGP